MLENVLEVTFINQLSNEQVQHKDINPSLRSELFTDNNLWIPHNKFFIIINYN